MNPPPALAPSVTAGALNFRLSPPPQNATQFGALRPPPPPPPPAAASSSGTPLRRRSSIAASLTSSPATYSTPKPRLAIPRGISAETPAAALQEGRDQPSSPRRELLEPEFPFHEQRLEPLPGSREVWEEEYDQAVDSKCRGWPGRAELREGKQGGGEQGFQGEIETRGWEIAGLGERWKAVGGGGTVWRGLPGLPTRQMGIEGAEEEARREEEERVARGDAGDEFGYARAVRRHKESLERRQAWGPPLRKKKVGKGPRRA